MLFSLFIVHITVFPIFKQFFWFPASVWRSSSTHSLIRSVFSFSCAQHARFISATKRFAKQLSPMLTNTSAMLNGSLPMSSQRVMDSGADLACIVKNTTWPDRDATPIDTVSLSRSSQVWRCPEQPAKRHAWQAESRCKLFCWFELPANLSG